MAVQKGTFFFYDPRKKNRSNTKVCHHYVLVEVRSMTNILSLLQAIVVQHDTIEFALTLKNPFAFDLEIQNVAMRCVLKSLSFMFHRPSIHVQHFPLPSSTFRFHVIASATLRGLISQTQHLRRTVPRTTDHSAHSGQFLPCGTTFGNCTGAWRLGGTRLRSSIAWWASNAFSSSPFFRRGGELS